MVSATQQEVLVQPRRLAKSSNGVEDGAGSCGDALNSGLRARERSAIHWRGAFLALGLGPPARRTYGRRPLLPRGKAVPPPSESTFLLW